MATTRSDSAINFFASQAKEVVVVDLAAQFIEKNRTDHADCANAMDLQFKDNYFDFIFINWLFVYLEEDYIRAYVDWLGNPFQCFWLAEKKLDGSVAPL